MEFHLETHRSWPRPRQNCLAEKPPIQPLQPAGDPWMGPSPRLAPSATRERRTQTRLRAREVEEDTACPTSRGCMRKDPNLSAMKQPFPLLPRAAGRELGPADSTPSGAAAGRSGLCGGSHWGPSPPGPARGLGAGPTAAPRGPVSTCTRSPQPATRAAAPARPQDKRERRVEPCLLLPGPALKVRHVASALSRRER